MNLEKWAHLIHCMADHGSKKGVNGYKSGDALYGCFHSCLLKGMRT